MSFRDCLLVRQSLAALRGVAGIVFTAVPSCAPISSVALTTAPPLQDDAPRFELVCDEPAVREGRPAAATGDDVLFQEEFTAFDARRWESPSAKSDAAGAAPRGVQIVADGEGARGIALLAPGEGGVHARIDLARDDAVCVRVRARSFATAQPALLRLVDVDDEGAELAVAQREIAATAAFAEIVVLLDRRRGRHRVSLSLVPGERPLAVDRVELSCLRPVGRTWLAAPAADVRALPRARLRVALPEMDAEMDGFYVPTGATLRWRARAPLEAPRLDVETGLVGGDRGGRATWSVVVDGVPLASRAEELAPGLWTTRFATWEVPLDGCAGREVEIELRCAGDRSVVGFAGTPRLAGRARPRAAPPNVVLVSLDTLRADRVGPHAGRASLTPRLDALAARGVRFTRASSTSSWTLPAHASIMTGQHPLVHGALDHGRPLDPRRSPLLAQRFRERGYATAAFTAGVFVDPHFGFAHGFDAYSVRDPLGEARDASDPRAPRDADVDATPRRALDWVRRHADVPFFLFLHTYHVHEYEDAAHDGANAERCALIDRATTGDAAAIGELARRYDACVTECDRDLLGAVLDELRALAIDEETVVAVVSDHGEEFLEHGGFRHGLTLRDEVGSVVLVVAGPGVPRGARVDAPVSLTDVAPTLAHLAGLAGDPRCEGRDLLAADLDDERPLLLHLDHVCTGGVRVRGEALWLGEWRLQRMWSEAGAPTLAFERRDAASGRVVAADPPPRLRAALERRLDEEIVRELRRAPHDATAARPDLPGTLRERLRALGYAGD